MADIAFAGCVEFSNETPLFAWVSSSFAFYRLVISDSDVAVEGRWRPLRKLIQTSRCTFPDLQCARLRGTLIILYLPHDEWWSISRVTKGAAIIRELEARGVRISVDP
jgi:hypothetical protein